MFWKAFKGLYLMGIFVLGSLVALHAQVNGDLGIIPAPCAVKTGPGNFVLNPDIRITYGDDGDRQVAEWLHDFLKTHYELDVSVKQERTGGKPGEIRFSSIGYKNKDSESYQIAITPTGIGVSGRGPGLFYGLQSLIQLFPLHYAGPLSLPCAEISDHPRYHYRGVMLGDSYHFYPVPFVKKLIDLMSEYKLNTLHWHLTDDNGWRIQIKKYPLLTQVGAWRTETQIGHDGDAFDGQRYGGYYTQAEVREIVRYAAARHVTIIPEIEMPGHCLAALASYPWLGCTGGPYHVATAWGIYKDIYCPTDSTFHFLENVLTEVMGLFPSHYIHIGGDEVPKDTWKASIFCQQLMKKEGLKTENELQSYFIRRIEKFVRSKGREIIGWDEILEGGLAPHATVESWRGTSGGIAAARLGHDVIMAPTDHVYFDYLQGKESEEPIAIGGYNPLADVYAYDPTPQELTVREKKHILGVEACIWTEFMPTTQKVEYMIFPRLMALSEIAWSEPDRKDYQDFSTVRLPLHLARLDTSSILYRVPEVIGLKDTTLSGSRFTLRMKPSVMGAKVYYTLDGYEPDRTTFIYDQPLVITVPKGQQRTLKVRVITPSGKTSNVTTTLLVNP